MSNTVTHEKGNFSAIPNELLNDSSISLNAKGLYVFMRGKPPAWNFTIRSMSKQLKEGETAIGSALNELKKNGWLSYTKHSSGKGVYHLPWSPVFNLDEPNHENPNQGYPMKGKPQRISNKEPSVRNIDNNTPIVPASGDGRGAGAKAGAQKIMELYNEVCGHAFTKSLVLNAKRQRQVANVCKIKLDNGKTPFADYNVQAWKAYFELLLDNPWNHGNNDRGWKATFDYSTRPDVVIKTLENKYA